MSEYTDKVEKPIYHVCCYNCGFKWWDNNAFPDVCPRCKKPIRYIRITKNK